MICNYSYLIDHPTVFFTYNKNTTHDVDLDSIRNSDCWFMIIDTANEEDMPFIKELIRICNDSMYYCFSVMGDNISEDVVSSIESYANEVFTKGLPKLIFSSSIATHSMLLPQTYVGTYLVQNNKIMAQAINAGELRYEEFSKIVCYAKEISSKIDKLNLSDIEKIVYIDNWFQENIQYIKNKRTLDSKDRVYYCAPIDNEATASDVFINKYGTCEDISASIAAILRQLKIKCEEIHSETHAWLFVGLENENYIWDCTYNITRNPNMAVNGIKATEYCYQYTLIGREGYDVYTNIPIIPEIAEKEYSREKLQQAIKKLHDLGIKFKYDKIAKYNSCLIKED